KGVLRLYGVASYVLLLDLAPALVLGEDIIDDVWPGSPAMVFSSCMPPCPEMLSAKASYNARCAVRVFNTWTEASPSSVQMPVHPRSGEDFCEGYATYSHP